MFLTPDLESTQNWASYRTFRRSNSSFLAKLDVKTRFWRKTGFCCSLWTERCSEKMNSTTKKFIFESTPHILESCFFLICDESHPFNHAFPFSEVFGPFLTRLKISATIQDSEKIRCFWHRIWNLRKIWRLIGLFAVKITHCWWSWSSKTNFGEKHDFAVHFEQNAVQKQWTAPRKNSYSKVPTIFWNPFTVGLVRIRLGFCGPSYRRRTEQ